MTSEKIISINVRVSSLAHWSSCPRQGSISLLNDMIKAGGYELNEEKRNISASVGTGVHAGAHHILLEKLQGREADLKNSTEIAIEKLKSEIKKGVDYDQITKNRNEGEQQIKTLTKVFQNQISPQIIPAMMEEKLEGRIPCGNSSVVFTLTGHPDCIEEKSIIDYKTGRVIQCYPAQLGGYDVLAEYKYETTYEKNIIYWLPRVPVTKPYPGPVKVDWPIDICVAEAKAVIMAIKNQVINFIDTKSPMSFPANPASVLCSKKYCLGHGTDYCPISQVDNGKR